MLAKFFRVIVACFGPGLLMVSVPAVAGAVATVTALVGSVAIQSASGVQRVAAIGTEIDNGDTVETSAASEVVMIFTDHQRVYLKPGSVFRVDDFNYAAED